MNRSSVDGSEELGAPGKVIGTQRKCANCGQVGHIKTNKKLVLMPLCPNVTGNMTMSIKWC